MTIREISAVLLLPEVRTKRGNASLTSVRVLHRRTCASTMGQPRFTSDAGATLPTDWVDDEAAVDFLLARFRGRRANAREFALKARVLLLISSDDRRSATKLRL